MSPPRNASSPELMRASFASSRAAVATAIEWSHSSFASKRSQSAPPRNSLARLAAIAMFFTAFSPSIEIARLIEPIWRGSP